MTLSDVHSKLSAGLGSLSIKMKTSISFDANKLVRWLESEDFDKSYAEAAQKPMVDFMKGLIKSGQVKTEDGKGLAEATKKERKRRKFPPSIGGDKPLYDTGRLAKSIRFDKEDLSIKAVDYAKGHIDGTHKDWNGKPVPKRDFVAQMHEKRKSTGGLADKFAQSKAEKMLISKIKQKFSRRLAK
tara:strand:- start:209 stop:763 length:555 start_codon:yes stop_codon:yes gene_type:complete